MKRQRKHVRRLRKGTGPARRCKRCNRCVLVFVRYHAQPFGRWVWNNTPSNTLKCRVNITRGQDSGLVHSLDCSLECESTRNKRVVTSEEVKQSKALTREIASTLKPSGSKTSCAKLLVCSCTVRPLTPSGCEGFAHPERTSTDGLAGTQTFTPLIC